MNAQTAKEYYTRLLNYEKFLISRYGDDMSIDKFVYGIKEGKFDMYEVLRDYCIYLQGSNIHTTTLKQRVVTVKNFLEFNDIDISPRKFKIKIRLPKDIKRNKEAIDKDDIINILNSCSDIKLKTYVMLLASTGMRAVEALSIRVKDLDVGSYPAKLTIRGEYTKTKVERYVFLTREMVQQFKQWLDYKYRTRRICNRDKKTGELIDEYRTPEKDSNHLVFSLRYNNPINKNTNNKNKKDIFTRSQPQNSYYNMVSLFEKTLDRNGMGSREESNENRRKITLHTFRRFAKTTISDLGYADYSEWIIGHAGSTYWRKKDNEKAEIFKKIEPYLTFLNIQQLNRQGADLETKIEELQDINQVLREKDKMKEDVIANLSDKLIMLSERLDAVERLTK
jgi:integrase